MREEMLYEKKEKRKYNFRYGVVCFLEVLLLIGLIGFILWTFELSGTFAKSVIIGYRIVLLEVSACAGFLIIGVGVGLRNELKTKYIKKVKENRFCTKVDNFLKSLGTKTIELRLCVFVNPRGLIRPIVDKEVRYYVRKNDNRLYIFACCDGREIWNCDTDDFKFFFDWFEPVWKCEEEDER